MLLMSFSGSFTGAYLEPDSNGPNLVSKICIFSPTVQFFMGLFTIIYRYPKFSAINREQDTSAIAQNITVDPLGEFGAQFQTYVLLIQIAIYGSLLILFILICKSVPPQEPGEIEPETDLFSEPKEVQEENERIENIIKSREQMHADELSPDLANEVLVVHNLVKRYYTAPPVDEVNTMAKEDRPSLHNREDD